METRGAVRRSALQRLAAEQLTQNWLQRQGPYAASALAQIQRNTHDAHYNNNDDDDNDDGDDRGQEEIEPGPVARATNATFDRRLTALHLKVLLPVSMIKSL